MEATSRMRLRVRRSARTGLCVFLGGLLLSCSGPVVTAVGDSNEVVIIHDRGAEELAELAVGVMEHPGAWLLGEPLFRTTLATPENAGDLKNLRHVLLVGSWDEGTVRELAAAVLRGLDPSAPVGLHTADDIWARRQAVGVVMGRDREEVAQFLSESGQQVRDRMVEAAVDRAARALYETSNEAGMAAALEERFGWSLAPPSGYDLFTTHAEQGFVFFRQTRPDRTVALYWVDGEPGFVSEQYAIAKREELSARYFDGDLIEYQRPLEVERVDFLGRGAVRISGWWGNRELVGGGPFQTYCFYDEGQGRVYVLDLGLFAPGFDKTALMRNLDAIAHTFRTAG